MARILISEPHEDVRKLLVRMVTDLGHEPLVMDVPTPERFLRADLFLVEPAAPVGAVLAKAAHLIRPEMPIVFVSVEPPPELDVEPVGHVMKPFTSVQLRDAIDRALGRGWSGHARRIA
jgi:two-component SAPR family response regulator